MREVEYQIKFVRAPDHLIEMAKRVLHGRIECEDQLRRDIRAVAKAYIDEADEIERAANDLKAKRNVQLETRSPPEVIEKARRLVDVTLADTERQATVREVAKSYVLLAEENQRLFDEFERKYVRPQQPGDTEPWKREYPKEGGGTMKVHGTGIPWYTRDNYAACLAIMDDAEDLCDSYDDWLLQAKAIKARIRADGGLVVEALIDPAQFPAWCKANGHRCDKHGRMAFANEKVRDSILGGPESGA